MEEVVLIKKEVELPKELFELTDAVGDLFLEMEKALADGFQAGQDIPVLLTAAMSKAMVAADGVKKLPAEVKAKPAKVAVVAGLLGEKVIDAFVK